MVTSIGERPPCPRALPLVGNTFEFMRDKLGFTERVASHGPVSTLRLFGRTFYLITSPELVQETLVRRSASLQKDIFFEHLRRIGGNGLGTSEGPLWRRQRKLVARAFTPARLGNYADQTVDSAIQATNQWVKGDSLELLSSLSKLTLDLTGRTLFGSDLCEDAVQVGVSMAAIDRYYQQIMASPFSLPAWWPSPQNVAFVRAIQRVDTVIEKMIVSRRAEGIDRGDFLGALLHAKDENGQCMSTKQIRDECMTVFIAGHDTSALALTYTLYLLSRHPKIKRRVRQEIATQVGVRRPTADDVQSLVYTKQVLKEAMRLYPPAWGLLRQSIEDLHVGGYHIPKGSTLMFSQWIEHRNPTYFPDPLRFDPDRWSVERAKNIHKFAYFPFGAGPRVCIGSHFSMMSLSLVIATLLQRCEFTFAEGADLQTRATISLRPANRLQVRVQRRAMDTDRWIDRWHSSSKREHSHRSVAPGPRRSTVPPARRVVASDRKKQIDIATDSQRSNDTVPGRTTSTDTESHSNDT